MTITITRRWMMAARPVTLLVGVSPVILGTALGIQARGGIDHESLLLAGVCLLAVICLQMAANLVNDVADDGRGVDDTTRRGPLRVTQAGLLPAWQVRRAYRLLFGVALLAALVLARYGGEVIIVLALVGVAAAYLYSGGPWPLSHLGLGELMALIFFGPLTVWGCSYLQTLSHGNLELVLGSGCGLWSAALMAINNYRDRVSDKSAGKRTLAVICPDPWGYALAPLCMCVAMGIMVWYGFMRDHGALVLPVALFFVAIIWGPLARLLRHDGPTQNQALGLTALGTFMYAVTLAAMVLAW